MSQKIMIALAASVTAFVLVIAGGIFTRVSEAGAAADPTSAVDPSVAEVWNQREAAYRDLIDQANQRLQSVSAPGLDSQTAAAGTQQAFAAKVSPDLAVYLALTSAPGARLKRAPELVSYLGTPAYEVSTTHGMVYVGAMNGAILYNGAAQMQIAAASHEGEDHESDD